MKIRLLIVVAIAFAFAAEGASADDLIESDVVGIRVASQVLAGITGGFPWVVAEGEAEVSEDGDFEVEVEGLLLLDGTIGPVVDVIASLHCLGDTVDGGHTEVARIGPVPLDANGDAEMSGWVELPSVCIGPVVLVRAFSVDFGGGVLILEDDLGIAPLWIAASGFKSDDDD